MPILPAFALLLLATTVVVLATTAVAVELHRTARLANSRPPGALLQLSGEHGCLSDSAKSGCARARGLYGAWSVAASPDGRNLYAVSTEFAIAGKPRGRAIGDSLVIFRRGIHGFLTQLPGKNGCINASGEGGCAKGRALDVLLSVTVSPDGQHVYATAAGGAGGVAVFKRGASGALTQLPGTDGCVGAATSPTRGCASARALANELATVISPDGRFAYVASEATFASAGGVAVFAREPNTGELQQLGGSAGCVSTNQAEGCARVRGLGDVEPEAGADALALSPDGSTLYADSVGSLYGNDYKDDEGLAVFSRDAQTGVLTQLAGQAGCVTHTGRFGCTRGRALLDAESVVVSPDGRSLYIGGPAIAVFAREADGSLRQLRGQSGCVAEKGRGGCASARNLSGRDPAAVAVSADSRNLYAAGNGIASFERDRDTGALRQLPGSSGCIAVKTKTCARGRALNSLSGISVSPDARNVYVAAALDGAVAALARQP